MLKQSYWWPISGHQLLDLAIVSSFAKRRDVRRSFVLLRQRPHCAGWNAELYSHKRVNSCNIANTNIYHDYICIIYLVIFIFLYMYMYTLLIIINHYYHYYHYHCYYHKYIYIRGLIYTWVPVVASSPPWWLVPWSLWPVGFTQSHGCINWSTLR